MKKKSGSWTALIGREEHSVIALMVIVRAVWNKTLQLPCCKLLGDESLLLVLCVEFGPGTEAADSLKFQRSRCAELRARLKNF